MSKSSKKKNIPLSKTDFPCHKYMLRNLKTVTEAKIFVHQYVSMMACFNVPDDIILANLTMFSSQFSLLDRPFEYDFTTWHTEGLATDSIVVSILFDTTFPTWKNCFDLYKQTDNALPVCTLCSLSNNYANTNKDIELKVLAYATMSEENYQKVKALGVKATHFKSIYDTLEYCSFNERPVMHLFLRYTWTKLGNKKFRNEFINRENKQELTQAMIDFHKSKLLANTYLTEISDKLPIDKLVSAMAEELLKAVPCSDEELEQYVAIISGSSDNNGKKAKGVQISEKTNLGPEQIDQYVPKVECNNVKEAEPDNAVLPVEQVINGEAITEKPAPSPSDSDKETVTEKPCVPEIQAEIQAETQEYNEEKSVLILETDTTKEEPKAETEKEPVKEAVEMQADDEQVLDAENISAELNTEKMAGEPDFVEDVPLERLSAEEPDPQSEPVYYDDIFEKKAEEKAKILSSIDEAVTVKEISVFSSYVFFSENSIICAPVIGSGELKATAICLDTANAHALSLFETYIYKRNVVAMEFVMVDSSVPCVMFFVPKLRAYFYSELTVESDAKTVVKDIVERRSIEKVCFFPYKIMSAFFGMGWKPVNFCSIHCADMFLYNELFVDMEDSLQRLGATKAIPGISTKNENPMRSIVSLYMHHYIYVYQKLKKQISSNGLLNEYEEFSLFNQALSVSYDRATFSAPESNAILFDLLRNNQYRFSLMLPTGYTVDGKAVHYRFRYFTNDIPVFIRKLVQKLYESGRMTKHFVRILSMGNNFLTLYIAKKDLRTITTFIQTELLFLLEDAGIVGFEYEEKALTCSEVPN